MNIKELNQFRAECKERLDYLGMRNTYNFSDKEAIKLEADYRLARDLHDAVQRTYSKEFDKLTIDQLIQLSKGDE